MYKWICLLGLLIFLFVFPDPLPTETGTVAFCFSPQSNCSLFLATTVAEMDACAFYDLDDPEIVSALQQSAIPTYVDAGTKTAYGIPIYQNGLMHQNIGSGIIYA